MSLVISGRSGQLEQSEEKDSVSLVIWVRIRGMVMANSLFVINCKIGFIWNMNRSQPSTEYSSKHELGMGTLIVG